LGESGRDCGAELGFIDFSSTGQLSRSTIIFLTSAIALPGFKPFGQAGSDRVKRDAGPVGGDGRKNKRRPGGRQQISTNFTKRFAGQANLLHDISF
jgi:hypothetical protein